jgi:hypothetical protein
MDLHVYQITIWELDDFSEENWLGPICVDMNKLACLRIVATGPRRAAAKAYVCVLGRGRARMLRSLNPPQELMRDFLRGELCVRAIARSLKETTNWAGPCYLATASGVQTWHLSVRRLRLSGARMGRLRAALCARRRRFRRLTRTFALPS